MAYINDKRMFSLTFVGGTGITDQDYNPESANAQSGKAVAQAVAEVQLQTLPVDKEMSDTSENPVQNKVVKQYVDDSIVSGVTQAFDERVIETLPPEIGEENVDYIPTARAVVDYVDAHTSGGGEITNHLKWQHLTTVEFEEEAQQFLSDKFPESVGIKGVFAKVYIPKAGATTNFMVRLLNTSQAEMLRVQPQSYISTTDNVYGQVKLELVNGMWDGWWTAALNAENSAWTARYGLRYVDSGKTEADLPCVYRIIIGAPNDRVLPKGTKMEVWVLKNG